VGGRSVDTDAEFCIGSSPPSRWPLLGRPRLRPNFVWRTNVSNEEAVAGIFFAGFFSWNLRGQVLFLAKADAHMELSERFRRRARHRLLCPRTSES